jgi:hypothetical protein
MSNHRDYSGRLIALSKDEIFIEEARDLIRRDMNPDWLFLAGPGKEPIPFEETRALRLELLFGEGHFDNVRRRCPTIQIDFINPTAGYLDMMGSGIAFSVLEAEYHLLKAMKELDMEPLWWMLICTTKDHHPLSAYRRSIIILNRDPDGKPAGLGPVADKLFTHDAFERLEDLIEESHRMEIAASKFE